MPWASTENNAAFYEPHAIGPVMQTNPNPPTAVPETIAADGTYDVGLMNSDGYKVLAVGATLSQPGSIVVQRYIDLAGQVAQGSALTAALTAAEPGVVNATDNAPFASFNVLIVNSGSVAAELSNFDILMNAN